VLSVAIVRYLQRHRHGLWPCPDRLRFSGDLARKKKYDEQFAVVFEAIKQLISPPAPPKKQIGFRP